MELAPDLALQGGVDQLVLPHPWQALEGAGDDARAEVIVVARQVLDGDRRIGEGRPQAGFQLGGGHGQGLVAPR